jgi:hypothetical protein
MKEEKNRGRGNEWEFSTELGPWINPKNQEI